MNNNKDFFRFLFTNRPENSVTEIRLINVNGRNALWGNENATGVVSGYFRDTEQLCDIINSISCCPEVKAAYYTINPVNPILADNEYNRLRPVSSATKDKDILSRNVLFIDIDPVRPSKTSATDEEKAAAKYIGEEIQAYLTTRGFPTPAWVDSGNGYHLYYLIDLFNSLESTNLIKNFLSALGDKFDTLAVKVDRTVYNAARISKLPGTWARKGEDRKDLIPSRPHRLSTVLFVPEKITIVTKEMLEEIISESMTKSISLDNPWEWDNFLPQDFRLDVPAYLEAHGVSIEKTKERENFTVYSLKQCLFNPDHKGGESSIIQGSNGALSYQCFHDSCQKHTWQEARQLISGKESLKPWMTQNSSDKPDMSDLDIPKDYILNNSGLYKRKVQQNKDGSLLESQIYLGQPLIVCAMSRTKESSRWGKLITWKDSDNIQHKELLDTITLTKTDGLDVITSAGYNYRPSKRNEIVEYIASCFPKKRVLTLEKIGWYEDNYCLPNQVIGNDGNEEVFFQGKLDRRLYTQSGSFQLWKSNIASVAAKNSRISLGICAAFAAPLLSLCGLESGGINLVGNSSVGKTTTLYGAASVWGCPDEHIRSWRTTDNGLEGLLSTYNDNLLCLDELSQAPANAVGEAAYMISNGQGKTRADKNGDARKTKTWRTFYLSTGEQGIADKLREVKKIPKAGQEVRLIDVPADAGNGHGIFEDICNFSSGAELSEYLKKQAVTHYGHAGRAFLLHLVSQKEEIESKWTIFKEEFLKCLGGHNTGQVRRVALRFAIVAFAGELATQWGILPWEKGTACEGIGKCYQSWLSERGSSGNMEDQKALDAIQSFIETHGNSRFEPMGVDISDSSTWIRNGGYSNDNQAGYKRKKDNKMQYLFTKAGFKTALNELNFENACRALEKAGWLKRGDGNNRMQQCTIPGLGRRRCYVIELPEEIEFDV